jgi:hypothetical protein
MLPEGREPRSGRNAPSIRVVPVTQPPMDPTDVARSRVRRHRRERQILIFGLILVGIGFIGFYFAGVYRGDVPGPFSEPFVTPPSEFENDINIACPPTSAVSLEPSAVAVRVLNGSDTSGLAGNTATDLKGRGFVVVGAGNAPRPYDGTVKIVYGVDGLVQAYTMDNFFTESEMVLDTRDSSVVDVVLGAAYEPSIMREQSAPELEAGAPFPRPQQCVPVELVDPVPAPRVIPDNPLESAEPSPSASPSAEPSDSE